MQTVERGKTLEKEKKKKFSVKWLLIAGVGFLVLALVAAVLFTPLGGGMLRRTAAPTVTLEVVEGPELDEESGMYRILVQAVVTGRPAPEVYFNRNDELGELEAHMTAIYLASGASFQLRASVTNIAGTATAALELTAPPDTADNGDGNGDGDGNGNGDDNGDGNGGNGGAPANQNPIIQSVTVSVDPIFMTEPVTFTVSASDPDGDPLTYHWIFLGPGMGHSGDLPPAGGSSKQYTPNTHGVWSLTVVVQDGRGGEAVFEQQYVVNPVVVLNPIQPECGWVVDDYIAFHGGLHIYVGETSMNKMTRGFLSFDIADIRMGTVHKVELRMANPTVLGNPEPFKTSGVLALGMIFYDYHWGAQRIYLSDYDAGGETYLFGRVEYDFTYVSEPGGDAPNLANAVQFRMTDDFADWSRFQMRIRFTNENPQNNNQDDGVRYDLENIYLKIWYFESTDN